MATPNLSGITAALSALRRHLILPLKRCVVVWTLQNIEHFSPTVWDVPTLAYGTLAYEFAFCL
jgi:hypothetical protein